MSFDNVKDPSAVLDYVWDWSQWLTVGETLQSVTWTVDPGLTKGDTDLGATNATIWLSGGTAGMFYNVTCEIVTTQNRTDQRTVQIICNQR